MRNAGMESTAELLEKQLSDEISKMTLDDAVSLARAFCHYLNLMGIAETHHRCFNLYSPESNIVSFCCFTFIFMLIIYCGILLTIIRGSYLI